MSARWIFVDELVTGGTGTLADPYTGWADELLNRLAYLGSGPGTNGNTALFSVGAYDTQGGLVIDGIQAHFVGAGGPGSLGSNDISSTYLLCTDDAPVVWFTNADAYLSSIDKLTLRGDYNLSNTVGPMPAPTKTNQDGLRIENGAVVIGSIGVSHLHGRGVYIPAGGTGSDGSVANLIFGVYCGGDAVVKIERGNGNVFEKILAVQSRGDGLLIVDGSSSNRVFMLDAEHNEGYVDSEQTYGYACQIKYVTGASVPRDNHIDYVWDEDNGSGSLKIDDSARFNDVGYISYSSAAPDVAVNNVGPNTWTGRDRNDDSAPPISGLTNLKLRHLETQDNGYDPTVAVGAAAGGSGAAALLAGKDSAGLLRVITGTSPTTGILLTLTFAHPYSNPPVVVLTPANDSAASEFAKVFVPAIGDTDGPTTTTFTFKARAGLTAATTYKFNFMVIGAN